MLLSITGTWTCCPFHTVLMPKVQSVTSWATPEQEAPLGHWARSGFSQRKSESPKAPTDPPTPVLPASTDPPSCLASGRAGSTSQYIYQARRQVCFLVLRYAKWKEALSSLRLTGYNKQQIFFPIFKEMKQGDAIVFSKSPFDRVCD